MSHGKVLCRRCGAVVMQCRCMEGHRNVSYVESCELCPPVPVVPPAPYEEEPGRDYRKERDAAYTERNRLVAALARIMTALGRLRPVGYPEPAPSAWLAEHRDEPGVEWDPEWRTVVFIETPFGQLSWHLHDSDVPLFKGLPRGENTWDGHTTEEKYARLAQLGLEMTS